jgi:hypothetical protein
MILVPEAHAYLFGNVHNAARRPELQSPATGPGGAATELPSCCASAGPDTRDRETNAAKASSPVTNIRRGFMTLHVFFRHVRSMRHPTLLKRGYAR